MPRIITTKTTNVKTEFYPSSSPSSDDSKTASPTKPKRTGKVHPWTPQDKVKIYEIAMKSGASAKNFEGVLEGRTGKQCYDNWK